jgi:hypothetical protein
MADKTIWGCAETGTYRTTSPNPHIDLTGEAATGFAVAQPFSGGMSSAETATVTVFKDSSHWAVYKTAKYTSGSPNIIDLSTATLLESAGTLSASDTVTVIGLSPLDGLARREVLSEARTYYVATTGSDSNTGLAAGSPFLTIQKAVDVVCSLDLSIYQVTIQVADGTYTAGASLKNYSGKLSPIIQGNVGTPANVIISMTSANALVVDAGAWVVQGFKLQTSGYGAGFYVSAGTLSFQSINFGACALAHVFAAYPCRIWAIGDYSISGGGQSHIDVSGGAQIDFTYVTVTITNTPNFTAGFVSAALLGGAALNNMTFSGSATGVRYTVNTNGVIFTNGGGASYLPGNSAGSAATGGQYV